jgi:Flp pilus assembly protein TadG
MRRRDVSGGATLEFAIIGPVFVFLLLLAMETGWQSVIDTALGAGARAASRFGSTGATVAPGISPPPTSRNDSLQQVVIHNSGGLLQASRLQIAGRSYASFAAIAAHGPSTPGPGGADQVVQYTFTYTQPYLTPIAVAIVGRQQLVHTVGVTVLNEPFPSN